MPVLMQMSGNTSREERHCCRLSAMLVVTEMSVRVYHRAGVCWPRLFPSEPNRIPGCAVKIVHIYSCRCLGFSSAALAAARFYWNSLLLQSLSWVYWGKVCILLSRSFKTCDKINNIVLVNCPHPRNIGSAPGSLQQFILCCKMLSSLEWKCVGCHYVTLQFRYLCWLLFLS